MSRFIANLYSLLLFTFGITLMLYWPVVWKDLLHQNLVIRPGSATFSEWRKPSANLCRDIYIFNWTNSKESISEGAKPRMNQLGPYRFREYPEMVNVTFNDENSTVSYRKMSKFYFDAKGSNGSLDDWITTVDMITWGAQTKRSNIVLTNAFSGLLGSIRSISDTRKARELMFEGYSELIGMIGYDTGNAPFDKIGWFYKRNASIATSAYYNVHTGNKDISKLGEIQKSNYLSKFPMHHGNCKILKGSSGELFPPERKRYETIYLFAPDMCRSIAYDYEKDITVDGISGYRYTAKPKVMDNGTLYEENKCYNNNLPSGVTNVSACYFGAPAFQSFPHFYGADTFYQDQVDGMAPDKDKHESYFTIEPTIGAPIEVAARFQTNFLITLRRGWTSRKVMMPIFYVEQMYESNGRASALIKLALIVDEVGQFIGIIMMFTGCAIILYSYNQRQREIFKSVPTSSNDTKHFPIEKKVSIRNDRRTS